MKPGSPRRGCHPLLILLAPVALLGVTGDAGSAQSAGHEPAVVELTASARSMGLGGAFQTGASDSDAVFHHPALALRASGLMVGYQSLGGEATGASLSAATDWYGGGIAVGLQTLEYGAGTAGSRAGGLDPILAEGSRGAGELVVTVAHARSLGPLVLGVAGKLSDQQIGDTHVRRGAFDVGVAADAGPLQAVLSVRNLGPEAEIDGAEVALPTEVTLGAGGYGRSLGPLDVGLATAVTRRADGEWTVGGGVELGYWPIRGRTFVVRVGGRRVPEGGASPVTFGGSFWGDDLVLEYAFEGVDDRDDVHRLSVGWR